MSSQNEQQVYRFVSFDHPHMMAAYDARRECAGDTIFPIGVVLVKNDVVVARAGNGFNRGSGIKHVCPRVVMECPSLTGYELCSLHDTPGHAENMLVLAAAEQGIDPVGCDVYMSGHWWCCDACWRVLMEAGIRDVFIVDDAQERFSRDRVYAETLSGSREDVRLQQEGNVHRVFVPESSEAVFVFEADSPEQAMRRFELVRKQL